MRQRKKRSAAITLVLVGAVSGCSEPDPQRDVYPSLASCQRDWQGPADCQSVSDGRYANSWYYGPSHYGSSYTSGRPRPSSNAVDAVHAPGTRAVSRGGFGSTGHSFSSSS